MECIQTELQKPRHGRNGIDRDRDENRRAKRSANQLKRDSENQSKGSVTQPKITAEQQAPHQVRCK